MLGEDIRHIIDHVQQGQERLREGTIKKYLPFILRVTSRTCKRYVRFGVDDEVSIAVIAFNEAINKYDASKSGAFFSYAENVINRRIIDYFRKNKNYSKEIPFTTLMQDSGEADGNYYIQIDKMTWDKANEIHFQEEINRMRREEIIAYQKELNNYGITLKELVEISPKHHDARCTAYHVARIICEDEEHLIYLKKRKSLPLKQLEKKVSVSRKTLERQRKYIIALSIIMMSGYYFLEGYLDGMKG